MRPHRRQPTRLPRPWDSPGKNIGVGCHFLLQCMKVKSESEVAESCPTLCNPMDCGPPGFSVHGIFQAGVLGWGAIASSRAWPQGAASPLKPQPEAQPQASECCPTPDGHSREKQSGSRMKAPCPAGLHTGGLHHHTKLNSGSSHTHPAPRFL